MCWNSSLGGRHEAPVALPGAGVELAQAVDLARELGHLDWPHGQLQRLAPPLGDPRHQGRHAAVEVVQPREQILDLLVARPLDERGVLRRVVRHEQHRIGVEPVDEQAAHVVQRRADRPADVRAPARLRPGLDRRQQRRGRVGVVGFEEAEHRDVVVVRLLVQAIVDRGDAADDAIAAPGEQQLHLGVRKERVLLRVDAIVFAEPQRRHPVRVARVALVHVVDEPPALTAGADRANLQHARGVRYRLGAGRCGASAAATAGVRP